MSPDLDQIVVSLQPSYLQIYLLLCRKRFNPVVPRQLSHYLENDNFFLNHGLEIVYFVA